MTVTLTRCVSDPFLNSTMIGELIEPVDAPRVTVLGIAPAEGFTVKPLPAEKPIESVAKVLNVPLPETETLPELPQLIVSAVDGLGSATTSARRGRSA